MPKEFDPRRLDLRRFIADAAAREGDVPLGEFERLAAEVRPDGAAARVHWSARGELRNPAHVHPEHWMHLEARTTLPLVCQRCLGPLDVPLAIARDFRFVADEATAAAEDDEAEEDVLVLARDFDLLGLVEDELLMDMPPVPRHETCPQPVRMSAADPEFEQAEAQRENPFAVLGRLKPGKH